MCTRDPLRRFSAVFHCAKNRQSRRKGQKISVDCLWRRLTRERYLELEREELVREWQKDCRRSTLILRRLLQEKSPNTTRPAGCEGAGGRLHNRRWAVDTTPLWRSWLSLLRSISPPETSDQIRHRMCFYNKLIFFLRQSQCHAGFQNWANLVQLQPKWKRIFQAIPISLFQAVWRRNAQRSGRRWGRRKIFEYYS